MDATNCPSGLILPDTPVFWPIAGFATLLTSVDRSFAALLRKIETVAAQSPTSASRQQPPPRRDAKGFFAGFPDTAP
jgi:hypothetical protein